MAVSLSSAARSSAVLNSRPLYLAGRSSGVVVALDHVPCKSGSPHGVRPFLAGVVLAGAAVCAAAGIETSSTPTINDVSSRIVPPSLLAQMIVQQVFGERHALELHELS